MLFWLLIVLGASGSWAQSGGFNQACSIINSLPCDQVSQNPVCGTDGVLYPSECEFAKAQCKNSTLGADNVLCSTPTMTTPLTVPSNMSPQPGTSLTTLAVTSVTTMSPMMDNTTSDNFLNSTSDNFLNSTSAPVVNTTSATAENTTSTDIRNTTEADPLMGNGTTPDTLVSTEAQYNFTSSPTPTNGISALCNIVLANSCPPEYSPVCATGNVEYPSLCAFTHAQCYNPDLMIIHGGPCFTTTTVASVEAIICEAVQSKPCNDDGVVLCGSDGITYSNSCEFEKERCNKGHLQIAHPGKC